MKEITREVLEAAREEYLKYCTTPPEQFNLKYSETNGWTAEFHKSETCWSEGFTTWWSGTNALELFFSLYRDDFGLESWDPEWNDK